MSRPVRVLAVDLGATSARVAAVELPDDGPPSVEVVHRYAHAPVRHSDGSLRWDWDSLVAEVVQGLEHGLALGPADSIGVDTWGVDYGLVDARGRLLSPPHCYRSERTAGWESVAERLGRARLYRETGIQLMGINTVFQLAAHDREELARAARLQMLPELMLSALGGPDATPVGERTSAATTGLVDLSTGTWSDGLLDGLGVRRSLLPDLRTAPEAVGVWRGVPLHLVGGHDTASAVVARPGDPAPGSVFVSSGSWLLVGVERAEPDVSTATCLGNFSNEAGALAGVRLLKNVVGLGMLEACRPGWGLVPVAVLGEEAAAVAAGGPTVDATDQRFLAPADMEAEVRRAAGLPASAGRDVVARCILDSISAAAATVVAELAALQGSPVTSLDLLGGGGRLPVFVHLLAQACGVPVRVGPAEATALGNALVQGIALGRYSSLAEARATLSLPPNR